MALLVNLEWKDLDIIHNPWILTKKKILSQNAVWEIFNQLYFCRSIEEIMRIYNG